MVSGGEGGGIKELNERRIRLEHLLQARGVMNRPVDPDERIKADAQFKLLNDAWVKAEWEYRQALATMSAAELEKLVSE